MMTPRILAALAASVFALAATGCGLIAKSDPVKVLSPQVRVAPDPSWPQVSWQLAIGRPVTSDALDSRRLLVSPTPGELKVYKGVEWDDSLPELVQNTVAEGFEDSDKILAVGHITAGLHTDYTLQMDIRDFQAEYRDAAGPPVVVLAINARLVDFSSSRVVASRTFREAMPAPSGATEAVVRTFENAFAALVHDMVGWALVSGQEAKARDAAEKH
jgi:cholesterol transport system auxiliary component